MATTAEGQAKLRKMLAAGMGRQQALRMLTQAQRNKQQMGGTSWDTAPVGNDSTNPLNPTYRVIEPTPVAPGWTLDDERGGFKPPAADEGTSVKMTDVGATLVSPTGVETPIARAMTAPTAGPDGQSWTYDDERGGWTPPPSAEGTQVIVPQDPEPSMTSPGEGWTWDPERGGWTPPAAAEGSQVIVTENGPVITMPTGEGNVPAGEGNVPAGEGNVPAGEGSAQPQWSVYEDPIYMQQLQFAQSQFNRDRLNALSDKERAALQINRELGDRKGIAEQQRRRLAGNFASRGMAGGRAGVLSRAEAEANARELTLRTDLRDQIAELNRRFVADFGANETDWLGTSRGAMAQRDAVQAAINARLAGLTTLG